MPLSSDLWGASEMTRENRKLRCCRMKMQVALRTLIYKGKVMKAAAPAVCSLSGFNLVLLKNLVWRDIPGFFPPVSYFFPSAARWWWI
ncbi:MAG: hypothetical protein AB7D00_09175, partial [Rhodospirillaceae bacterium]